MFSADGKVSKTLYFYVFWNLVKVFGLASAVIAGIMSFGGLLKQLTGNGLSLGQVVQMLGYAMPAMQTYSLPIAALFATTVVYGRLAADNEVTAVRAAGISLGPLGMGLPALVGGVLVSILALFLLNFIVPSLTLKMERTVVSNLGQIVVNRIQQQHQVHLAQAGAQPMTIFAQNAWLEPTQADEPETQIVTMTGVSIVNYAKATDERKLQVPEEFYIAKQARVYIRQAPPEADEEESPVQMRGTLTDGMKFPRQVTDRQDAALQGGVKTQTFGPFPLQSPLRENTKFMDIRHLQYLQDHPEKSQRMRDSLADLIRNDQQRDYLESIRKQLVTMGQVQFLTASGERYSLRAGTLPPRIDRFRLILGSTPAPTGPQPETVRLIQTRGGDLPSIESDANEARMRVYPDDDTGKFSITMELQDAVVKVNDEQSARDSFERSFTVPMPENIKAISSRTVSAYLTRSDLPPADARLLIRNLMKQNNSVISEMHSRISFGLSCIVLTLVGYGLGVVTRSGNYLNAFAVSVVPAIISIVLIVTGQHICENIPPEMNPLKFHNPLHLGLVVIWSGNVIVLGLAIVILTKLRRT